MNLSLDQLNSLLNQGHAVYEHYYQQATGHPLKELNDKMISPFPRDGKMEEDPSFSIYLHRSKHTIFFKDHGLDKTGTHWQFVMDLFGIDFKTAVAKVKSDILGINQGKTFPTKIVNIDFHKPIKKSTRAEIIPVFREWDDTDYRYFKKEIFSRSTLDIFHCQPLSHFELRKENKTFQVSCHDKTIGYCYSFPSGHQKICQPFGEPHYKWTSNLSAEMDIFGFDLVPKECEHLFLVGGNRDCMAFYEHIGHPVIALASESANIPDEIISIFKRITKNIWILYDNDTQGYRKAKKFEDDYGFQSLNHLYKPYNVKDFTQFMEYHPEKIKDFAIFLEENINVSNNYINA